MTVKTEYVVNPQAALSQVLMKTVGNEQTYYVYGLGLIGQEVAGEYSTYHFDLRGSTVAITNANGKVTDRYQYSAYGEILSSSGNTDTPFLYNGRDGVMTDTNGLYYMRARYYNPQIRRFVSQDILLGVVIDGQSLNRYAYVQGNPVGFVDPLGLARDGSNWQGDFILNLVGNMEDITIPAEGFYKGIGVTAVARHLNKLNKVIGPVGTGIDVYKQTQKKQPFWKGAVKVGGHFVIDAGKYGIIGLLAVGHGIAYKATLPEAYYAWPVITTSFVGSTGSIYYTGEKVESSFDDWIDKL